MAKCFNLIFSLQNLYHTLISFSNFMNFPPFNTYFSLVLIFCGIATLIIYLSMKPPNPMVNSLSLQIIPILTGDLGWGLSPFTLSFCTQTDSCVDKQCSLWLKGQGKRACNQWPLISSFVYLPCFRKYTYLWLSLWGTDWETISFYHYPAGHTRIEASAIKFKIRLLGW